MATTFTLREMEDPSTEEICKVLNISATNLWVVLHRARAHLRRCLEMNWFGQKVVKL
jgi:RNA polymerase sigma-70 factor (ECF subfamily)